MSEKSCRVELVPDEKYSWRLHLKGDCSKTLKEIHENQGEYSRRYLDDRLVHEPGTVAPAKGQEPEEA